ncbi:hypothetical protein COV16_05210, partial [Candidatus Woesearchaeota archaeon CG10_big_fil_rev_8_21_14_0_10_34_8]
MDHELVGRLAGYAKWGSEAFLNKQEYENYKAEICTRLNNQKNMSYIENLDTINELQSLLHKKQIQMNNMNLHVFEEIKDTIKEMMPLFEGMHAELFAKEIENSSEGIFKNSVALHDAVLRQSEAISSLNEATYAFLLPNVLFLYDRELELRSKIKKHASVMHNNGLKLVNHMKKNYFERLSSVSSDKKFLEDHHDLLVASYLLSVCSRAAANVYGVDTNSLEQIEDGFIGM